jgi:asparagine synthase (glutamine-hydrolysing)
VLDRLPADRVGILMSGGIDSSTLAAKAVQLGSPDLQVFARTWRAGGKSDPEAEASSRVAEYLGLHHTLVEGDSLRFDQNWRENFRRSSEPSLTGVIPSERFDEARSMRSQAQCWFYGEGPDNALTFEWQMDLRWIVQHRELKHLPNAIVSYLTSKSIADWRHTFTSRIRPNRALKQYVRHDHSWVRGAVPFAEEARGNGWRPAAHANLESAAWPFMFESLEDEYSPAGIEWRHPFMDLRVLEFLLAVPPIPWGRRKLLIRQAMQGLLPKEILSRPKTPLHRDVFAQLLRQDLAELPKRCDALEAFVDMDELPNDPSTYPDVYALTRLVILQRWLEARHG